MGHFHAITSITGFLNASYFCEFCMKAFNMRSKHQCVQYCGVCKSQDCIAEGQERLCEECNMICRSDACFARHSEKKTRKGKKKDKNGRIPILSECDMWWKCPSCTKTLDRTKRKPEQHVCGEWVCMTCRKYQNSEHHCFHRARKSTNTNEFKYIFFDFECTQDRVMECSQGYSPGVRCEDCENTDDRCRNCLTCTNCEDKTCGAKQHTPNLVVAQTACHMCQDKNVSEKCNHCGNRCQTCSVMKEGEYVKPPCNGCGHRQIIFEGATTTTDFCSWVFRKNNKDAVLIAHNMKGYDGYFIVEYLIANGIRPRNITYSGAKIMSLFIGNGLNIRMLDSLNFLSTRLSALPKSFGLKELKKGYFPHFFNTADNAHYVGPLPDKQHYGVDNMSRKERETFIAWHDDLTSQGYVFDFRKELLEYCVSDVTILREACLCFRKLLLKATTGMEYENLNDVLNEEDIDVDEGEPSDENEEPTENENGGRKKKKVYKGIDPFKCTTIAGMCMSIYKNQFLVEYHIAKLKHRITQEEQKVKVMVKNEDMQFNLNDAWVDKGTLDELMWDIVFTQFEESPIAQVPPAGYTASCQYSKSSIAWLEWVSHTTGRVIQHALNGNHGEYRIPGTPYHVDGYEAETKSCWEFLGCIWHGCMDCYPVDRTEIRHPYTRQTMNELYVITKKRERALVRKRYNYNAIWECEFKDMIKNVDGLKEFVDNLELEDRLDPRESFFGGRTNAAKLYHKTGEDERVLYSDVTSLYPYVNKYGKYPVGHPQIITKHFKNIGEYFGIAKVKILPPRQLYHPVLPFRSGGKLKFPLCRTCATLESKEPCGCSDEERSIIGTWCTPEIETALTKGYEIQHIYEIYHWENTTQYDKETGKGGLFAEYINCFLKLKQEASGWPAWCQTEEDKLRYITLYKEKEGILLDYAKIEKNPGLRSLAKLCLNSFWGKFGQRLNFTQSTFIHESESTKYFGLLTDVRKQLHDFHILAEDTIHIQWHYKSAFVPLDNRTNVFIASFTTCFARLKLYELLDTLQRRVLYYDTDSVIYTTGPGEQSLPVGDYLGDLTDELDGGYITEFVSGGPKNYAYRTSTGEETCKVRGFTLNYKNSCIINFESVKNIVKECLTNPGQTLETQNVKIARDRQKHKLYNRVEKKSYRMVYTKRVIQPDFDTLPYGY